MKLVTISDTHLQLGEVIIPEGDILIHAGDLTSRGEHWEIERELDVLQKLNFKHKIVIVGNHDWLFQKEPDVAKLMCKERDLIYLEDSAIELEGLKFYGSPWQPFFCNWAFNLFRGKDLEEKWKLIPNDTDILITHGPPHKILDRTMLDENVGCEELNKRVMEIKPIVHIFGHIHDCYGTSTFNDVLFVNASNCDEMYKPVNKPFVIEIEDKKVVNFNPEEIRV